MEFWVKGLAAVGGAVGHFQKEIAPHIQPGIENAIAQAGHHYHNDVVPAVGAACHHLQKNIIPAAQVYFNNNVAPTVRVTIDNTVFHLQTNVAPSVHGAALRIGEHVDKKIAPAVKASVDGSLAHLRQKFGDNFEKVPQVVLPKAEDVKAWVSANPGKTAIIVMSGVVLLAPGLVTGPALGALGFGAEGVGAATVAAGVQSGIGNVAAGSSFAILQSAGAGGLGSVVVNGAAQGIAGIALGSTIAETVVENIDQKKEKEC